MVAVAARTLFVSKGIGITRASPPPMSTDFAPRPKRARQACLVVPTVPVAEGQAVIGGNFGRQTDVHRRDP